MYQNQGEYKTEVLTSDLVEWRHGNQFLEAYNALSHDSKCRFSKKL